MRTGLIVAVTGCMLLGWAAAAPAINCEQVRRYLATGRSAESIAETMIVSVDEVKKCGEQEGGSAPTPQPETGK